MALEYPFIIVRGLRSYKVYNEREAKQVRDFLGIEPVGTDLDTYVSRLDLQGLENWKNYWVKVFGELGRTDLVNEVNMIYVERRNKLLKGIGYPKIVEKRGYRFLAYDEIDEKYLKKMLYDEPGERGLDNYIFDLLVSYGKKPLEKWRNYWLDIWERRGRKDLQDFVREIYRKWSERYEGMVYGYIQTAKAVERIEYTPTELSPVIIDRNRYGIKIVTDPRGATVYLNGAKKWAKTPNVYTTTERKVEVKLYKKGYDEIKFTAELTRGKVIGFMVNFKDKKIIRIRERT
jgi:hypothetical protein